MAHPVTVEPTPRDGDVLAALDRCPLTVAQLLKLSAAFALPFTTERRVQERMQLLAARGYVHRWLFAVPRQGTLNYYTLSREGYRALHGHDAPLPGRGTFAPTAPARLRHAQALADFIVHATVAAHAAGFPLTDFSRENSLRLEAGGEALYPDCAFSLPTPGGETFRFFGELDNVTESLHSRTSLDSWERKVRLYEAYKDDRKRRGLPHRFRVLVCTTGTALRLQHLLACAARLLRNPQRALFLGVTLADYLACGNPLTRPCFLDHRGQRIALLPPPRRTIRPTLRAEAALVSADTF